MITVELKIYFSFRTKLDNNNKITIEVPDSSTVGRLLEKVAEKFPDFEGEVFEEPGKIRRFIQIRLNQRSVNQLNGLQTRLEDGDKIQILPKLGGG